MIRGIYGRDRGSNSRGRWGKYMTINVNRGINAYNSTSE